MKILIFSVSIGGGHDAVARNLKSILTERDAEVEIVDALGLINKKLFKVIADGYLNLTDKVPLIYESLYKSVNNKQASSIANIGLEVLSSDKILDHIEMVDPDLIIATHPFVVAFISKLKKSGEIDLPFVVVVTDFKAHMLYESEFVDAYIVASPETKRDMIKKGFIRSKVFPFGIPVDRKFFKDVDKKYKRKKKKSKTFSVLIMGGALGFHSMGIIVDEMLSLNTRIKVRVICGKNEELYNSIQRDFKHSIEIEKLEVYGFIDNVHELMEKSDVLITKPGGVTVTEAIIKRLPLIIPYHIPGQESENADFLAEHHMAIVSENLGNTMNTVDTMAKNPIITEPLRNNMDRLARKYSLDNTGDLIVQLARESKLLE